MAKKSKATLKDLDFERVFPIISGGLRIRPADYERIAHRINQDARVLAELEIMDHSLVRVRPVPPRARGTDQRIPQLAHTTQPTASSHNSPVASRKHAAVPSCGRCRETD